MKRSLDRYAAKRTFTRTPEPAPTIPATRVGPLLFVVQKHAARRLHYDFRLEVDGILKSWAVPKGPSLEVGDKRLAVETEDHPFDYASFEGVIPEKEYGAGNVIVWDCGVYSPDEERKYSFDDRAEAQARVRAGLAAGKLSFFLRGEKLKGSFALVRTSSEQQWLLLKHQDRFAGGTDLLAHNTSVLCGATLDAIHTSARQRIEAARLGPYGPEEAMPRSLAPMLAEIGEELRSESQWLYEPKLDGYRVIAFIDRGKVKLQSRGGLDLSPGFPEIITALADQAVDTMILDGEIVALDAAGRPSFNALQNRAQLKTPREIAAAQLKTPALFVCFDLLHFGGLNLRDAPYCDRRRYLRQCLLTSEHVQLIHTSTSAETLYDVALATGFEGVVAKRHDSPYRPGRRSPHWLKFKATRTQEFVIGGYTKGRGARSALGALIVGQWKDGGLQYVGHVGSGFDENALDAVLKKLAALTTKQCPFSSKPPRNGPPTWVTPQLVAEVSFQAWTADGYLRAPVFIRLRDDVEPMSVRAEQSARAGSAQVPKTPRSEIEDVIAQLSARGQQLNILVGEHRVRVTNLDREYWPADPQNRRPAITKRDHLRYLVGVSPFMLPHLRNRPLTMIRMPEGIHGERFFQKHWPQERPSFVEQISVFSEHKDEHHEYLLANSLPALLWFGQVGTLEFHVWHSRAELGEDTSSQGTDFASSLAALESSVLNYPDYLVFDIDPYIYSGKEAQGEEPEYNKKGFGTGKRVAFWINDLLKQMSLQARVKTSGKTGLHVFVPIDRTVTFDGARAICETVGRHVMRAHPKDITMEWAVVKRTGKIFIDYNMNVRGKTLNVAYSPRGVSGAPISMPLTWEELEAAEPMDFTMHNVLARLEKTGDRWHDILSSKQSLAKAFGSSK